MTSFNECFKLASRNGDSSLAKRSNVDIFDANDDILSINSFDGYVLNESGWIDTQHVDFCDMMSQDYEKGQKKSMSYCPFEEHENTPDRSELEGSVM